MPNGPLGENEDALAEGKRLLFPRAKRLEQMAPQLVADVTLYSTSEGGKKWPALPRWGCPCAVSKSSPLVGYDGWLLLGNQAMHPGEKRRLGFVFLSGEEAAKVMRSAGLFYLWEGRFIGEATVIS